MGANLDVSVSLDNAYFLFCLYFLISQRKSHLLYNSMTTLMTGMETGYRIPTFLNFWWILYSYYCNKFLITERRSNLARVRRKNFLRGVNTSWLWKMKKKKETLGWDFRINSHHHDTELITKRTHLCLTMTFWSLTLNPVLWISTRFLGRIWSAWEVWMVKTITYLFFERL